jgi:2-dehydro-3-deoxyphosphooctonate aldolase (KDO 8-P synthase)
LNTADLMVLVAGPCVIEDEGLVQEVAQELRRQCQDLPVELYFKASFDKANRSSIDGFRGPGLKEGLRILERLKVQTGHRLFTDLHTSEQASWVAEVVDFLQVPAFLCRQTDIVLASAWEALKRGRKLNIKKGQFLAPWDAEHIVSKVRSVELKFLGKPSESPWFWMTERGTCFGYNNLVVDMIAFQTMQAFGVPVLYDATHSIQTPGRVDHKKSESTGGQRKYLEVLARAAMAAGAQGVFLECHPRPDAALSDGSNALDLRYVGDFVKQLLQIRTCVSQMPKLLPESQ